MMRLCVYALASVAGVVEGGYVAIDLKTNGIRIPHNDDMSLPAGGSFGLSWGLKSLSPLKDAIGVFLDPPDACEIELGAASETEMRWHSGKLSCADGFVQLPSELTSQFKPQASYRWKVRPLGGIWSDFVSFDTAPSETDWEKSEWIGGANQLRADLQIPLGRTIRRARAYAAGLGSFSLHINGQKVGDRIMDPGQAVYDQKVLFVTFNVTSLLRPGVINAIGAVLGNGKWGYLDIYANRTALGDQSGDATRAFRMLLNVELDNGAILSSDTASSTWKMRHGPIVYDHMWHGEIYDTRREMETWDSAPLSSFPAGEWSPARALRPNAGRMSPQGMEGIRVKKVWEPINVTHSNSSTVIYDFGQNMAGTTSLTVNLKKIQARFASQTSKIVVLRIKHTEIQDDSSEPYNNFYPGMEFGHASKTCSMADWYQRKWFECANQTNALIFPVVDSGSKELIFTPSFTYQGFRFAELVASQLSEDGHEEPLDTELAGLLVVGIKIVALQARTDVERVGTVQIEESSGILQRIFNSTIMSHVSQLWSIPTDCPQREKRGWMGDAGITSDSLQTFFHTLAFHANFLELIVDNQLKGCGNQPQTSIYGPCSDPVGMNGSVPDVTPFSTGPYGVNPGFFDWQATFVLLAGNVLKNYGKQAVPLLIELWTPLENFMAYAERNVDSQTGLLLVGARGDWIPPAGQPFATPVNSTAAFFHTLCVAQMAKIAQALGKEDEARRYTARLEANRKAYHATFFNALHNDSNKRCCYDVGSQTSNMYALYLKAVPAEYINATVEMLVASIHHRGAKTPDMKTSSSASGLAWGSGPHLDVGIFGSTWMFDTLVAYGHGDLGLDILKERSYPSFGYFIDQDATTLWESWDGDVHHIGSGTSRNHIMYGGGVNRFLLSLIGLSADDADSFTSTGRPWGKLKMRLSRHTIQSISCASASRKLPHGIAATSWCRQTSDSSLALNVTVPLFSKATVVLPLHSSESLYIGGCKISCSPALEVEPATSCAQGYLSSTKCLLGEIEFVLPAGDFQLRSRSSFEVLTI